VATILGTLFLFLPPLFKTTEGVVVGFQIFAWAPNKKIIKFGYKKNFMKVHILPLSNIVVAILWLLQARYVGQQAHGFRGLTSQDKRTNLSTSCCNAHMLHEYPSLKLQSMHCRLLRKITHRVQVHKIQYFLTLDWFSGKSSSEQQMLFPVIHQENIAIAGLSF
jgi:hypothetical protein